MKTYNLLDLVVGLDQNNLLMDISFFTNEEDALKVYRGNILCGSIEDNTEYLCCSFPLGEEKCDAVMDMYNAEYKFFYKIEP